MPRHTTRHLAATIAPAGALVLVFALFGCEPETTPAALPAADRAPEETTTGEVEPGAGDRTGDTGDTGDTGTDGVDLESGALVTAGTAAGTTAETTAETAKSHLDAGRKLIRKGAYRRAMAELEMGLEIDPKNPYLWSEHGWAAFRVGELDTAEESTNKALEFAARERARASMLYNLGRIAEKRGRLDEAAGYYEQSLRYRPNKTVRKRLAKVEAKLDAAEG